MRFLRSDECAGWCRNHRYPLATELANKYAGTFAIARIHSQGSSLGEILMLECGDGSRTEQKYGKRLNRRD
jgi:hypothetical protein